MHLTAVGWGLLLSSEPRGQPAAGFGSPDPHRGCGLWVVWGPSVWPEVSFPDDPSIWARCLAGCGPAHPPVLLFGGIHTCPAVFGDRPLPATPRLPKPSRSAAARGRTPRACAPRGLPSSVRQCDHSQLTRALIHRVSIHTSHFISSYEVQASQVIDIRESRNLHCNLGR